jgi:hypothetical protein
MPTLVQSHYDPNHERKHSIGVGPKDGPRCAVLIITVFLKRIKTNWKV